MRTRGMSRIVAVLAAVSCLLAPGARPIASGGETIRINGSGIALDMMKPLVAAYSGLHPDVIIEMEKPLGSSGALKALLAGAMDLVVSSKQLTPEQALQGAKSREYGQTPLAIVVEKSVPRSDITTSELEDIYGGKTAAWPNGERVRIVLRPDSDIDTTILKGLSTRMAAAVEAAKSRPGMLMAVTDPESTEVIAKTPGGIGASGLPGVLVVKAPVKVLSLNGVRPGVKALADHTYPMAKDIRFVTRESASPALASLVDFAYSREGRAIAEQAGVLVTTESPAGR